MHPHSYLPTALPGPGPVVHARRRRLGGLHALLLCTGFLALFGLGISGSSMLSTNTEIRQRASSALGVLYRMFKGVRGYDWRGAATFRVTQPMRISIALSLVLGVLLGIGVGVLSGLEPSVVIGVSASMALGCVFVMSFAIVHGVNVLRATCFAIFVSACLPAGFGFGFGFGCLLAVFMGLENPDDVLEKTHHFVTHFSDFARVVFAFTLTIL